MRLESLANEILLDLFEFINGVHLLRAFFDLNSRFNQLLVVHFQRYDMDFRSISKQYFNIICKQHLPLIMNRIVSLHLSNDDETPNLPNVFLSYGFTLDRFNHLQSLKLYYIRSIDLLNQIINQCLHLPYLLELDMIDCYFLYEKENIRNLINTIWSLPKLTHWKFNRPFSSGIWLEEISTISSSIKYLSIEKTECYFTNLSHLFKYTPYLRQISTSIPIDFEDIQFQTIISSMISLKLIFNSYCISSMKNLFQIMPNLHHVTLHITSFYLDGYEWEKILKDYLPRIKKFHLKMHLNYPNFYRKENEINKFLDSFRTYFWIEKHQSFVRYDWNPSDINGYGILYTLPYVFKDFIYSNEFLSKSTCINDRNYSSYDYVTNFLQINDKNNLESCSFLSSFRFPNIRHLEINFPFNDNLWLIIPKFNQLTSLYIKLLGNNLNYKQLQELFNRASHLDSLTIGIDNWISIDFEFFRLESTSIRQVRFVRKNKLTIQYLNNREFGTLINSSIVFHCNVLALGIENRTKVLDLIKTVSNLQSLILQCQDDTSNYNESLSINDELIEWLCSCLPSTYSITRDIGTSNIRLWIDR
ncbi:unnamed protein product [Rotaria sordida]|uniref:F-box domain-containing protein n=3 Tax=Rotaria sordida TaxID=392033 RepID=A0A815PFS1_9BILA|nr:unnamed protein product [Rotaria sordida]CAF1483489.1 unnamed protein product [Rotaria sordida]CAF4066925.1 unnamed protein product [Rotaria sordida]